MKYKFLLIAVIALILRIYGINWDQGFHLHPDERMLLIVADKLHFFKNLNPDFYNYGSLPLYILKGVSQLLEFLISKPIANYYGMLHIGRFIVVVFDLLTLSVIYKIANTVWKRTEIGLFSAFIYALSFFPIQNTHFFTVDIILTFFISLCIYLVLLYIIKPGKNLILAIGIVFASMMATKFTAIVFLPLIILVLIFKSRSAVNLFYFGVTFLIVNFIFMPFAYIEYKKFLKDIILQLSMGKDLYYFPYTLQFVDTLPYWHYLKNIVLWGLGPFFSLLSALGFLSFLKMRKNKLLMVMAVFYLFYFLIIGGTAVKFMRYMLPLYPFFALAGGYAFYEFKKSHSRYKKPALAALMISAVIWTVLFVNIYSYPNTRVSATEWILKNIKPSSRLAVEYWDDYLPLYNESGYQLDILNLYTYPDNQQKWDDYYGRLKQSDYVIISSQRIYLPLMRLTDCNKYKKCFPNAAKYYESLFNGTMGFKKIKEFTVRPGIQIGSRKLEINDENSDESFTVFDHPKVMIFKKE